MAPLKTYSYQKAGELLRDDKPYSERTIERMVDAGDLERMGDRARRGISERSIIAYQEGERGIWRKDGEPQEPATPARKRTANGRRSTPSQATEAGITSSADLRRRRQPRGGWPA